MFEGLLWWQVAIMAVAIGMFVAWVAAIVDVLKNEPNEGNDRIVWTIVVVFMHIIGTAIYFIVRRPQRIAQIGH